ncbi:uncharacterized protein M421DRAFT_385830 [Didymella exigua CBS 183.55]|uniref:Uncharacterized protein n=1 Tax=Didymella exigua CBS 183.55 TaxID=1150837 RepID=A0A6A5RY38_9PLEO|nr:uncharacterized protein M421DRAFT_385830 [Didymella exigua CBS 183.55]KAF1930167.1 hypothetical protein M421DRAFT_385830 [Didymella exigua CBS 183.55]
MRSRDSGGFMSIGASVKSWRTGRCVVEAPLRPCEEVQRVYWQANLVTSTPTVSMRTGTAMHRNLLCFSDWIRFTLHRFRSWLVDGVDRGWWMEQTVDNTPPYLNSLQYHSSHRRIVALEGIYSPGTSTSFSCRPNAHRRHKSRALTRTYRDKSDQLPPINMSVRARTDPESVAVYPLLQLFMC